MVDDSMGVWLIECNSSPSLEYSTKVTKRLVKAVMADVAKVLVDRKSDTGHFTCIYRGEPLKPKYYKI
jgi:hypothetical protein